MQGEIITIGDELTSGRVLDLNAFYAAGQLTASGLRVARVTTVGDDPQRLAGALREAVLDSEFVVVTGGLGSTEDDLTSEIVANALGRPLCLDQEKLEQIRRCLRERGMEATPAFEKMAWLPRDGKALTSAEDICGFSLMEGKARLYFLPGVPEQMRFLLDKYVLPEILCHCENLPTLQVRILKVFGLSEPAIAEALQGISKESEDLVLGFYPNFPENHVTLSLRSLDEPAAARMLDRMEEEIRALLDSYVFGSGTQTMAEVVGHYLRKGNLTLSTAESCTGGLIGNLLTNVPGSSDYYVGGMVVYSNRAKADLLQVLPQTLDEHGAVSGPVVVQMAEGVRRKLKSDLGLAVTGIAGPDGGSKDKPVGTVHIGLSAASETLSGHYRFLGKREQVKLNTATMALDWVRRYLSGNPFIPGL